MKHDSIIKMLDTDPQFLTKPQTKKRQPNNKQKRHMRGFNEDIQKSRHARINFKKYIQEIEEAFLEQESYLEDDENQ